MIHHDICYDRRTRVSSSMLELLVERELSPGIGYDYSREERRGEDSICEYRKRTEKLIRRTEKSLEIRNPNNKS